MDKKDRYDTSGLEEAQFEPGSKDQVLKNLLGIRDAHKMERAETEALEVAFEVFTKTYNKNHRFTAKDICFIHKAWLKKIYSWAGQYRNTNLSKDNFHLLLQERFHV